MRRPDRSTRWAGTALLLTVFFSSGCARWLGPSNDQNEVAARRDAIKSKLLDEDRPRIISEIAVATNLTQSPIENIGLVTQLDATGGPVRSSTQREKMLDMMRRHDVHQPNTLLDSPSTTLAVITSVVPPAAYKGDTLDAVVKISSHSEATDLLHGWLMETPLMEMSVLGGEVKEGFDRARVSGSIVTNYQINGSEENNGRTQGIIVGAGRLLKKRNLGISVDADFADAITMSAIVPAINKRFTYFNGSKKTGIATPRDSNLIELETPDRYRWDPFHFANVALRIGFGESSEQKSQRIDSLQKQLREPTTVREACWQLEALGEEAIPLLQPVLSSSDPEIRFYSAHALAYLNDNSAIPHLKILCLQEPAFRAMCLNGLVILEDFEAEDTLRELLHAADPEVRYGAVRALRRRNSADLSVMGRTLDGAGAIVEIPSSGPPLVALSLSQVPEVVVFGDTPRLHIPEFHYVNPKILLSPTNSGKILVSHFAPGEEDQEIECDADLRSVLETIAQVGGKFGDWVRFLREAHTEGYFAEPFAMNPIPVAGRRYERLASVRSIGEPGDSRHESTYFAPEYLEEREAKEKSKVKIWNPLTWGGN